MDFPLLGFILFAIWCYVLVRWPKWPQRFDDYPDELCVNSKFFKNYLLKPKHKVALSFLFAHLIEVFGIIILCLLYIVFGALGKLSMLLTKEMGLCYTLFALFVTLPILLSDIIIERRFERKARWHLYH